MFENIKWTDLGSIIGPIVAAIITSAAHVFCIKNDKQKYNLNKICFSYNKRFANFNFIGREEFLKDLYKGLKKENGLSVFVIFGMGGVGKTETAIKYLWKYKKKYNFICWFKAETIESLEKDYKEFAIAKKLIKEEEQNQSYIIQQVKNFLKDKKNWLLIFDNVDADKNIIEEYIDPDSKGHIIITSRLSNWEGIANTKPLDVFTEDEAIRFLKKNLKVNYSKYSDDIQKLAKKLGYIPLALVNATSYINKTTKNPALYIKGFNKKKSIDILNKAEPANKYPYTIAKTWQISIDKFKESHPKSIDFLNKIAFLAPDNINLSWFTSEEGLSDFIDNVVNPLASYSLISRQEDNYISINRLFQTFMRDSIDEYKQKEYAEEMINIIVNFYKIYSSKIETWEEENFSFIPLVHLNMLIDCVNRFNIQTDQAFCILNMGLKEYNKNLGVIEKILGKISL